MPTESVAGKTRPDIVRHSNTAQLSTELQLTNDPKLRTAIRADEARIATFLVSIFHSKSDEETVLRLEGHSAQHFLDVVQEVISPTNPRGFIMAPEHTKMALRIIRKLSALCDKLPSSLFIVGVTRRDEHPTFGGGFGDIYRALYRSRYVALKRMRHFLRGSDLCRIRSVNGPVQAVHISNEYRNFAESSRVERLAPSAYLTLLGIYADGFPSFLCMVSPWMEHGTAINYLKNHGHANVNKLLYETAQGLEYLHSHNIVHGDLRGPIPLILYERRPIFDKEDWSACLTDFGLSIFSDAT
ncbi:hypothetical protein B0H12DRAFT_1013805, partial [Mycena haematopus]